MQNARPHTNRRVFWGYLLLKNHPRQVILTFDSAQACKVRLTLGIVFFLGSDLRLSIFYCLSDRTSVIPEHLEDELMVCQQRVLCSRGIELPAFKHIKKLG